MCGAEKLNVGERVVHLPIQGNEVGTVGKRDIKRGVVAVRWDSGNFGIYKVGEGEGEVRWVKCKCRTLNLLTPVIDLVEERKEEKTIEFDPEFPSLAFALPVLPPCQRSFAPLNLMCPSVETMKGRTEEEATPLNNQLATAQKTLEGKEEEESFPFHTSLAPSIIASLNIEDSFLSCPVVFHHSFLPVSPPSTFASSPLPLLETAHLSSFPSPLLFSPTTSSPMIATFPDSGLPKKGDTLLLLSKASNTWHKVTLTSHEKVYKGRGSYFDYQCPNGSRSGCHLEDGSWAWLGSVQPSEISDTRMLG